MSAGKYSFTATGKSRLTSRARYVMPNPPPPSWRSISYSLTRQPPGSAAASPEADASAVVIRCRDSLVADHLHGLLEAAAHAVERAAQHGHFVAAPVLELRHAEVAGADLVGVLGHPADRPHDEP